MTEAARRPGASETSPMMRQYRAVKDAHPDCLLFFRMGDFYEMFFDDAVAAAAALDIALTRRGRHQGADVPMCGVPAQAAESYLQRLIRKGFRVAVCDQTEDPSEARKRSGKALVAREVVRVVTPGTLTEDALLDARRNNYLAALAEAEGGLGLAWLDLSTGEFHTQAAEPAGLSAALARIDPGELVLADRLAARADLAAALDGWEGTPTALADARFDSESARRRLHDHFGVATLDAFGAFGRAEIAAAGAVLDYVALTQSGRTPRLSPPKRLAAGAVMEIDAGTRRNLELVRSVTGAREGSLLDTVDLTLTGAGGRELAARLAAPLTEPEEIHARQAALAVFHDDSRLREAARAALKPCPDLARAVSRLALGRGGPRDLAAVRDALGAAEDLAGLLDGAERGAALAGAAAALAGHGALREALGAALGPELPAAARDGGFVAAGHDAALDEERALRDDSRRLIAGLQARYAAETGIASLKIRHNNVLGYFVEVSSANAGRLAGGDRFTRRQTMASAERFSTAELGDLERRLESAAERALARELEIFDGLAGAVAAASAALAGAARALAGIDVAAGLAQLAIERRYVRPEIDDSGAFEICGGRHPVVEAFLERGGEGAFIANDCDLGPDRRLWLVTGPNMAGKSTFLRQNALIAVLAQAGAFVPAERARIGVVDRLFSRVGAADDLARGRSTFMVEMVETAAILNQAGPRALVILDEIGRGTATFDGLSIAWAALEHLHDVNRARALFATHFHELTALTSRLDALRCQTMRVKEWGREVVFLHEVAPGAANRSYGIHVARLAGLPAAALARAEEVLGTLEAGEQSGALARLADDLPLFAAQAAAPEPGPVCPVREILEGVAPDALAPRAALDLLYRLRAALDAEDG